MDARLKRTSELIPILETTSCVVSGDVHSPSQTPAFDSSAIDGYAAAFASTRGASVEKPHRHALRL
jgi:molybdopterin biosynthesis enzyme